MGVPNAPGVRLNLSRVRLVLGRICQSWRVRGVCLVTQTFLMHL